MIIDQSLNTHQSQPPSQEQQCLDSDDTSNFDSNMESASSSSLSNTDSSEDNGTESDIELNQDDNFNLQWIGQAIHQIWAGMNMEDFMDLNSKIYYFLYLQ